MNVIKKKCSTCKKVYPRTTANFALDKTSRTGVKDQCRRCDAKDRPNKPASSPARPVILYNFDNPLVEMYREVKTFLRRNYNI